jgi:dihydroorotate dehydrogenase
MLSKMATSCLHAFEPETAHDLTLMALKLYQNLDLGDRPATYPEALSVDLAYAGGVLRLPSCLGIAAGFDKNAEVPQSLLKLGFGFVECGTVTPLPQSGNPRPRLYRLAQDLAIINRLGFNNKGLELFCAHIAKAYNRPRHGVIGANIGANKNSVDRALDYVTGLKRLWGRCSYFTLNISSPNTPGLRELQGRAALEAFLLPVTKARQALVEVTGQNYPLFLKIAPDLEEADIIDAVETCIRFGLDALIVANTTVSRSKSLQSKHAHEPGGLSGTPLFSLSNWALKTAFKAAKGRLALIGVGGVGSGLEAYAKIKAGAVAVQLYTALVYKGPALIHDITKDVSVLLKADGFSHISQAVGTDDGC